MQLSRELGERYSPLYFLNALVAGGLALSFYMYLYWMTRGEQSALPSFDVLYTTIQFNGFLGGSVYALFLIGFLYFSTLHVRLFLWNLSSFRKWQTTVPYKALMQSPDKTILLTIPATMAVSILLVLVGGLMFLPFGFSLTEIVLPPIGLFAVYLASRATRLYAALLDTRMTDETRAGAFGNNLGQMIAVLCFLLLGLVFAVIAAASMIKITFVISFAAAGLMLALAGFIVLIKFLCHASALTTRSLPAESSPLFWMGAGLLSIAALVIFNLNACLNHVFNVPAEPGRLFATSLFLLSAQLILVYLGWALMRHHGFIKELLIGKLYAPGHYALLGPVLSFGFLYGYIFNVGILDAGLLRPFSAYHLGWHVPLLALHGWAVYYLFKLNKRLFSSGGTRKSAIVQPPKR